MGYESLTSMACSSDRRRSTLQQRVPWVIADTDLGPNVLEIGSGPAELLMSKSSRYMENPFRQNFFRAGHAHAGVIVILSVVCQMLADSATLPISFLWFVRIAVPFAAVLISAGFFFSVLPSSATQINGAVSQINLGAVVPAVAVVSLGIGLIKAV